MRANIISFCLLAFALLTIGYSTYELRNPPSVLGAGGCCVLAGDCAPGSVCIWNLPSCNDPTGEGAYGHCGTRPD